VRNSRYYCKLAQRSYRCALLTEKAQMMALRGIKELGVDRRSLERDTRCATLSKSEITAFSLGLPLRKSGIRVGI